MGEVDIFKQLTLDEKYQPKRRTSVVRISLSGTVRIFHSKKRRYSHLNYDTMEDKYKYKSKNEILKFNEPNKTENQKQEIKDNNEVKTQSKIDKYVEIVKPKNSLHSLKRKKITKRKDLHKQIKKTPVIKKKIIK